LESKYFAVEFFCSLLEVILGYDTFTFGLLEC